MFTEPAGGWSGSVHETARLTGPNNDLFFSLAASGQTVVASGEGAAYVFTEPAGGWSSETEPAALTAPTGGSVAISGQVVVSSGGGIDAAYVFVSPSAGWSNQTPAATLTAAGPAVTSSSGRPRPRARSWSRARRKRWSDPMTTRGRCTRSPGRQAARSSEPESAKLIASDGTAGDYFGSIVAISGDTVVAGSAGPSVCTTAECPSLLPSGRVLHVFAKPPGGWSGTVTESAKLTVAQPDVGGFDAVAISANTIVARPLPASGANIPERTLYVFTKPAAGWSGTAMPSATLVVSRGALSGGVGPSIAISGRDIFASASTSHNNALVFVFHRPNRGWTGIIHQHATLTVPSINWGSPPIATFGSSVVAGVLGSSTPAPNSSTDPNGGGPGGSGPPPDSDPSRSPTTAKALATPTRSLPLAARSPF